MAKRARKKTKTRKKAKKRAPSRKKTTRKKVVRRKTTRKKKTRKTSRKKTVRKKKTKKKRSVKKTVSTRDKSALRTVIKQALNLIGKINKKEKAIRQELDRTQKKMFTTKDSNKKLQYFFKMEGLKIDAFTHVEKEYKALSPLLNKAYKHADRIGGLIRDDFLDICQGLSKGINLIAMERDLKKMHKDL